MKKLFALSKNTFKETIRDKILMLIIFFAVLFLFSSHFAAEISARENDKITLDFGLAMINIFGILITIFVGSSLIYKEVEYRTIFTLLSKPIHRSCLVLSKFFGLAAVLLLVTILMSLIFFYLVPFSGKLFLAIAMMFLSFLLLLSVVIFFSSFMSPLLSIFSSLIIFIIGNITDDLRMFAKFHVQVGETSEVSSTFKYIADAIYFGMPNFEILNLKNKIAYDFVFTLSDGFLAIAMAFLFIIILNFFAVLIFSRKEF